MPETTSTTVSDLIPAISIPGSIDGYRYAPDLSGVIARTAIVPRGSGGTYVFPRWEVTDSTRFAGYKTEAVQRFLDVTFSSAVGTAVAGVVGMEVWLSKESQADSTVNLAVEAVAEGARALRNRLTADLLGLITGASTSVGVVGDIFDLGQLDRGLSTWESTNPGQGKLGVIIAPSQWRDLTADLVSNAAPIMGVIGTTMPLYEGVAGYKGELLGASLFVSSNVATETTGRNAVITMLGQQSGLGCAVFQPILSERTGDATAFYADSYLVHTRYGVCLVANGTAPDTAAVELISRAS